MSPLADLWLVRHGHAEHHQTNKLQWPEVALTAEGHQQATLLAIRLATLERVESLYSSPLPRALDTARPIGDALHLDPILHPDLREIEFGQAGGLTLDEFRRRWPEKARLWDDPSNLSLRWPAGESRSEFQQRAVRTLDALVQAHLGQHIIVVAHTGTLRCYLAHLFLGHASRWREIPLRPASVSHIRVGPLDAQIIQLDDCSHLNNQTLQDQPTYHKDIYDG